MSEGSNPDSVMILVSGKVAVTNKRGLRVVRDEIGTTIGEIGFVNNTKRTASVSARGGVEVLILNSSDLRKVINDRPLIGVRLMKTFVSIASERMA